MHTPLRHRVAHLSHNNYDVGHSSGCQDPTLLLQAICLGPLCSRLPIPRRRHLELIQATMSSGDNDERNIGKECPLDETNYKVHVACKALTQIWCWRSSSSQQPKANAEAHTPRHTRARLSHTRAVDEEHFLLDGRQLYGGRYCNVRRNAVLPFLRAGVQDPRILHSLLPRSLGFSLRLLDHAGANSAGLRQDLTD